MPVWHPQTEPCAALLGMSPPLHVTQHIRPSLFLFLSPSLPLSVSLHLSISLSLSLSLSQPPPLCTLVTLSPGQLGSFAFACGTDPSLCHLPAAGSTGQLGSFAFACGTDPSLCHLPAAGSTSQLLSSSTSGTRDSLLHPQEKVIGPLWVRDDPWAN